MRSDKVLTISVAAYNVADYIAQTIESFLIPEIINDIEVLIIDDGSSDHTLQIARRYEEQYPDSLRVIEKENGGHGSTVNRGIEEAQGCYFKTVDGDDWVAPNAFCNLVKHLKDAKDDVVVTNYDWVDSETEKIIKTIDCGYSGVEYRHSYLFADVSEKIYVNMHGMTYRTELLKNHPPMLDEHCFYVDAEFVLLPILWVNTISFLPDKVYQYRLGREEQSMTLRNMQKHCDNHEKVMRRLLEAYDNYHKNTMQESLEQEKSAYLAKGIARIAASQIKIYLSYPPHKKWKAKIIDLGKMLKENYPEIYCANENKAVTLLRISKGLLYGIASRLLKA